MTAVARALRSYRQCRRKHGSNATDALAIATRVIASDPTVSDVELGAAIRALLAEQTVDDLTAAAQIRFLVLDRQDERRRAA